MSASLPHTNHPSARIVRHRAECWDCPWSSAESVRLYWAWHEKAAHFRSTGHNVHITQREV